MLMVAPKRQHKRSDLLRYTHLVAALFHRDGERRPAGTRRKRQQLRRPDRLDELLHLQRGQELQHAGVDKRDVEQQPQGDRQDVDQEPIEQLKHLGGTVRSQRGNRIHNQREHPDRRHDHHHVHQFDDDIHQSLHHTQERLGLVLGKPNDGEPDEDRRDDHLQHVPVAGGSAKEVVGERFYQGLKRSTLFHILGHTAPDFRRPP